MNWRFKMAGVHRMGGTQVRILHIIYCQYDASLSPNQPIRMQNQV